MALITTWSQAIQNIALGRGCFAPTVPVTTGAGTAGAAASGFFSAHLSANVLTTTLPATPVGFPLPPVTDDLLSIFCAGECSANGFGSWLAWFYRFGTVDLTATGDKMTRDSWTAPVTRTQFGATVQPLTLVPLLYITTATTTTAAVMLMKTAAGAAGYKNQDGTTVVGTATMTMPAAATAVQSGFIIRLEAGDSGVQDITKVNVTTAASAGAASVYGVELIAPIPGAYINGLSQYDSLFSVLSPQNLVAGAPTSGSFTQSFLGHLQFSSGALASTGLIIGARAD